MKRLLPILFALLLLLACDCHDSTDQQNAKRCIPASLDSDPTSPEKLVGIENYIQELATTHHTLGEYYTPDQAVWVARWLNPKPDAVIADIGCGTGAFEIALLESKHPFGKLYAVDISQKALDLLQFTLRITQLVPDHRVETICSTFFDTSLPRDSVDIALLINTPILFTSKGWVKPNLLAGEKTSETQCIDSIRCALKPDGQLHEFLRIPKDPDVLDPKLKNQIDQIYHSLGFVVQSIDWVELGGIRYYHGVFSRQPVFNQ